MACVEQIEVEVCAVDGWTQIKVVCGAVDERGDCDGGSNLVHFSTVPLFCCLESTSKHCPTVHPASPSSPILDTCRDCLRHSRLQVKGQEQRTALASAAPLLVLPVPLRQFLTLAETASGTADCRSKARSRGRHTSIQLHLSSCRIDPHLGIGTVCLGLVLLGCLLVSATHSLQCQESGPQSVLCVLRHCCASV